MAASGGRLWSRDELIAAFRLYCLLPFGKLHKGTAEIIDLASLLGRTPSSVAMKLVNLASLDPAIRESGRKGLGNASEGDREVWQAFHTDWQSMAEESTRVLQSLGWKEAESVASREPEMSYEGENREAVVLARLRQSFFRRSVLSSYRGRCCMTGLSDATFLVASHIIPWTQDASNRLNPRNGLCLSTLHDRAYDHGLLTVLPDYTIKASPRLRALRENRLAADWLLGLDGCRIEIPERFLPDPSFLAFHADEIFQG
jgi:predicted restriction endonuclease